MYTQTYTLVLWQNKVFVLFCRLEYILHCFFFVCFCFCLHFSLYLEMLCTQWMVQIQSHNKQKYLTESRSFVIFGVAIWGFSCAVGNSISLDRTNFAFIDIEMFFFCLVSNEYVLFAFAFISSFTYGLILTFILILFSLMCQKIQLRCNGATNAQCSTRTEWMDSMDGCL